MRARLSLIRSILATPLLAAAVAGLLPMESEAVTPDNVHPRLFFYADSLDVIRTRCVPPGSPNHQIYLTLKEYVDGLPTTIGYSSLRWMQYFAAMYILTEDPSYADIALNLAFHAIELNATRYVSGEGNGLWGISQLILVYDWCYDYLTPEQALHIQDSISMNEITYNPSSGSKIIYTDNSWGFKYGMIHDAAYTEQAQIGFDKSVNHLQNSLSCVDQLTPGGSSDNYYGKYYRLRIGFLDALKHSSGVDLITSSPHMQNSGSFWNAILRTDYYYRRIPAKYNSTGISLPAYAAWQGSRLGDRRSQSIVKSIVDSGDYSGTSAIYLLLYYNPTLDWDTAGLSDLNWNDDQYGWYAGRTGWSLGPGSTDITTFFSICPTTLNHRGVLHYEIQRGGDDLILKSSYYEGDVDFHWNPWLNQAIAFNTVLIYDPDEFSGGSTPNTGQQTTPYKELAMEKWPNCTWINGTGYMGEITNIRMEDEYTLIEADATYAYSSAKASQVLRRWHWVRPSWFIVQDRVVLAKDDLPVKTVLHSILRPQPPVQPTTVLGSWDLGGVFTTPLPQSDPLVIEYRNSSARVYICDAGASGGSGGAEMRFIGGTSRNGEHWRQALDPGGYGYVPDPIDASFEFYVESTGGNYMPTTPSRVNDSDVEHRYDTPPRIACDWRTEITVLAARDTVDIAYLVHVVDRFVPLAEVTYQKNGSTLAIRAVSEGDTLVISLPPPGRESGLFYPLGAQ